MNLKEANEIIDSKYNIPDAKKRVFEFNDRFIFVFVPISDDPFAMGFSEQVFKKDGHTENLAFLDESKLFETKEYTEVTDKLNTI